MLTQIVIVMTIIEGECRAIDGISLLMVYLSLVVYLYFN